MALLLGAFPAAGGGGLFDQNTPAIANAMAVMGIAGYLAGAPVLHLIQDRSETALGSLGFRAVLPVLGGVIGPAVSPCPPPAHQEYGNCGSAEIVVGLTAGALVAIVLDATALAWKPAQRKRPTMSLGFAPLLSSDGERGELRVFGSF
ncbi:MAG TPA: hypothetical protein VJV79_14260 [Polyangiaceae bacterium]|nr:hypothetical protein [Polyangiaceae bacterium]